MLCTDESEKKSGCSSRTSTFAYGKYRKHAWNMITSVPGNRSECGRFNPSSCDAPPTFKMISTTIGRNQVYAQHGTNFKQNAGYFFFWGGGDSGFRTSKVSTVVDLMILFVPATRLARAR